MAWAKETDDWCPDCSGTGEVAMTGLGAPFAVNCPRCGGTAVICTICDTDRYNCTCEDNEGGPNFKE